MNDLKKCEDKRPIVAICYDFDKTLSPKDMQEFELIPRLKLDSKSFWEASNNTAAKYGMDKMLSYMLHIIKKSEAAEESIKEAEFIEMGKTVELFEGVETWFDRINEYGDQIGVNIEHYIISAGLKEILSGTIISKHFTDIFASSFLYNHHGVPYWPKQVVNYTSKTQYLFRINKGCMNLSDEESVNKYMPDEDRRIPFRNFIYIGDSATDIPAMRIISREKGHSIGVYNPNEANFKNVFELIEQERINYFAPANYTENSTIENLVKRILSYIKIRTDSNIEISKLNEISLMQIRMKNDYLDIKSLLEYFIKNRKKYITKQKDLNNFLDFYKQRIKHFKKEYNGYDDLESIIRSLEEEMDKAIRKIEGSTKRKIIKNVKIIKS